MLKIKKNNPLVIFSTLIVFLIVLHSIGLLAPLEDFLLSATKPLTVRLYDWGTNFRSSYQQRYDRQVLQTKVQQLEKLVNTLTVANSRCLEINASNQKLRSILKLKSTHHFQTITATIIAKQLRLGNRGDLIIDRGRQSGLRPGLAIINSQGIIIGKIMEVKNTSAIACLSTNINCKLAAAVQNQTLTQGVTSGNLGLTIQMNFIPQSEKLKLGEMIITSGLENEIPRGLLIGKISQIHQSSNAVWQTATIQPLINFDNLTIVSIVIPQ